MQSYPLTRMRRLRTNDAMRRLVSEHTLNPADFILPLFVTNGVGVREPIAAMPDVDRLSPDLIVEMCGECVTYGIPAVALFPRETRENKTERGEHAFNDQGLVQQTVRLIKDNYPDLLVITDVALDPYTSHGQDGLINDRGDVLNDETVDVLCKQALSHARAGADIVAPSDMMDGRIGSIRQTLEDAGFHHTAILAYSAKFASHFYNPFRDAVDSNAMLGKADKKTYQLDPANNEQAIQEVALDIAEGADMVMVKPGMMYLDMVARIREAFAVPTFVYQVSGEYAMLKAAAKENMLDEKTCVLETLLSFKRAGAHAILTYYALQAAKWLND